MYRQMRALRPRKKKDGEAQAWRLAPARIQRVNATLPGQRVAEYGIRNA
jgi:hypothetical protein